MKQLNVKLQITENNQAPSGIEVIPQILAGDKADGKAVSFDTAGTNCTWNCTNGVTLKTTGQVEQE